MRAIVLLAHGSRDPEWAQPFEALRARIGHLQPGAPVALAYLDHIAPTLDQAVSALSKAGASIITIYPLFLGPGGHLKRDLPRLVDAIRTDRPSLSIELAPVLGEAPEFLDAVARWIVAHR